MPQEHRHRVTDNAPVYKNGSTLLPPLNDDCISIILSMLDKPDLAVLSATSRLATPYAWPCLVRSLNVARSAGSQFINRDICSFVFKHALGPYIEVLRMTPSPRPKMLWSDVSEALSRPGINESLHQVVKVIESATNLHSFRIDACHLGYFERESRILTALQQCSRLRKLQLTGLGKTDVDALLANPIPNLRCLELSISGIMDVEPVFGAVSFSAQTLEELSVSYIPLIAFGVPDVGRGNIIATCPRLQRLSLHNIAVETHDISRACPNLQHLMMNTWDYALPPFTLPTSSGRDLTFCDSFPELRSIAGHTILMALPLHSRLQRLHIDQNLKSQGLFEKTLKVLKCSPLTSVSLHIRVRSPAEKLPRARAARGDRPFTTSYVISAVADCIPHAQFLEISFSWGRFRPKRENGFSPEACFEWGLTSESACSPLAALSDLQFMSFTVPGPRDEDDDKVPNMQGIAQTLLHTLPNTKYLSLRSRGFYKHRLCFRRNTNHSTHSDDAHRDLDSENCGSQSTDATVPSPAGACSVVEVATNEAHSAYQQYSWQATGLQGWCNGGHEWQ
ncbi:hypothetical protein EVG20_g7031 [Dentipellis fragilis]|uniref:F-box domain-containing protein n=1 Tax=Dentipellis fragilis TaxID=205917 RepID=A0A4Y9YG23_9AGAM|nr:hypothetical protein EVG20_g7031 [Dentipellis fragilis]